MLKISLSLAAVLAAGIGMSQEASAQAEGQRLGNVHFDTSCSAEAQKAFDQAMLYQHSFWYRASKKLFEDALKADPSCAIAYWGIAQSLLANPFNPTPAKNLAEGLAAIEQGQEARRKDAAGKRSDRSRWRLLRRLRITGSAHPSAGIRQGDG